MCTRQQASPDNLVLGHKEYVIFSDPITGHLEHKRVVKSTVCCRQLTAVAEGSDFHRWLLSNHNDFRCLLLFDIENYFAQCTEISRTTVWRSIPFQNCSWSFRVYTQLVSYSGVLKIIDFRLGLACIIVLWLGTAILRKPLSARYVHCGRGSYTVGYNCHIPWPVIPYISSHSPSQLDLWSLSSYLIGTFKACRKWLRLYLICHTAGHNNILMIILRFKIIQLTWIPLYIE